MHRLWHRVLEPIFDATRPAVAVQVSARAGRTTELLLRRGARHGLVLHLVGPDASCSLARLAEAYDHRLVIHSGASVAALERIASPGLVVLDGDHNWYTVFHELKALQAAAGPGGAFPVVLLHDVDWPYGRRDAYRDPAAIPARWRQPTLLAGALPGHDELAADDGLNPHLHHSLVEGTSHNGVRTALEDFVRESAIALRVATIPGAHGVAVVIGDQLLNDNRELGELMESFDSREFLADHCRRIDVLRSNELVLRARLMRDQASSTHELADTQAKLAAVERELARLEGQTAAAATERDRLSHELLARAVDADRLEQELEARRAETDRLGHEVAALRTRVAALEGEHAHASRHLRHLSATLREREWIAHQQDRQRRRDDDARDALDDEYARKLADAGEHAARTATDHATRQSAWRAREQTLCAELDKLRADAADANEQLLEVRNETARRIAAEAQRRTAAERGSNELSAAHRRTLQSLRAARAQTSRALDAVDLLVGDLERAESSRTWRWGHRAARLARALTLRRTYSDRGAVESALLRGATLRTVMRRSLDAPQPRDPR